MVPTWQALYLSLEKQNWIKYGPHFQEAFYTVKEMVQYSISIFLVRSLPLQIGITEVCFQESSGQGY